MHSGSARIDRAEALPYFWYAPVVALSPAAGVVALSSVKVCPVRTMSRHGMSRAYGSLASHLPFTGSWDETTPELVALPMPKKRFPSASKTR